MRTPIATVLVLAVAAPAFSHHGFGDYDETKVITLTGVVESFTQENPHSSIALRVGNEVWALALPSVAGLEQFGLSADAFAIGSRVTVKGYPHKKARLNMRPEWVVRDGKNVQISMRSPRQPPGRR